MIQQNYRIIYTRCVPCIITTSGAAIPHIALRFQDAGQPASKSDAFLARTDIEWLSLSQHTDPDNVNPVETTSRLVKTNEVSRFKPIGDVVRMVV